MPSPRFMIALAFTAAFAPSARALDLVEVWRAAARHDPEFSAARAAHAAGQARRTQAGTLWRPSVSLEGGVARASNEWRCARRCRAPRRARLGESVWIGCHATRVAATPRRQA